MFGFDVTPDGSVFTYTAIGSCTDGSVVMDYLESPALHQLGTDSFQEWFSECDDFPCETFLSPTISRDQGGLASADRHSDEVTFEFFNQVRLHRMTAPPPAVPAVDCTIRTSTADNVITAISWAPDSTSLVFEEYQTTDTFGEFVPVGLWTVSVIGTSTCEEVQDSLELVRAGSAASPDWGPADADQGAPPPPRPPPGGGGSRPPAPDTPLITLTDGARLDGGGAADPVAQTVATSEAIW